MGMGSKAILTKTLFKAASKRLKSGGHKRGAFEGATFVATIGAFKGFFMAATFKALLLT